MRLVTFSDGSGTRLGAVLGDNVLDLARAADVPGDMLAFLDAGEAAWERARGVAVEVERVGVLRNPVVDRWAGK